ncbi:PHP domain-containing protein [Candidatus Poribacteria bacterium]|nr:PHP domain-containing protein [Candidatus Poribacteria bacterium]
MASKFKIIRYADLHLHTDYSDGVYSPRKIVAKAKGLGLSAISITDHDILDGIKPAIDAGLEYGVEVIPGVELSAKAYDWEIHILGYYINRDDENFQNQISVFREARKFRAMEMVDKLNDLGIDIDYDDVFKQEERVDSIGRPHVASALMEKGYVGTKQEAFDRFLFHNGPAYVPKKKLSPQEAIAMILNVGGIPVMAHPGMMMQGIIPELVSMGLMGVEVYHPNHSSQDSDYLARVAKEYNLLITGGSDYHGGFKSSMGSIKLPYEHVEALKEARNYISEKINTALDFYK